MKRKRSDVTTKSSAKKPRLQRQGSALRFIARSEAELKNLDTINNATITVAQTTANKFLLNGCDDIVGPTGHIGRRITMKNLSLRWTGSFAATTAGASPLRILIVYDKQVNATTPATATIVTDAIYGPMNLQYSRRFKVLVDEQVECLGAQGPQAFHKTIYRDFTAKGTQKGLEVEFNDAGTADVTSITTGAIFALVWQNGKIITADPQADLYTRIRYSDM